MLDGLGDSGGQQPDHLCHRVWLKRTKNTPELSHLHLGDVRLNTAKVPTKDGDANASPAAVEHGILRRTQGHSSAMLIHESRILQVTIFGTLYNNLSLLNFNLLLPDVMTIADAARRASGRLRERRQISLRPLARSVGACPRRGATGRRCRAIQAERPDAADCTDFRHYSRRLQGRRDGDDKVFDVADRSRQGRGGSRARASACGTRGRH